MNFCLCRCHEWIRWITDPINVLVIVDVQNDFIDGTLALHKFGYGQNGLEVVEPINQLVKKGRWNTVVYTQDWHPENHISFYENLSLRQLHPESKVPLNTINCLDIIKVFGLLYCLIVLSFSFEFELLINLDISLY